MTLTCPEATEAARKNRTTVKKRMWPSLLLMRIRMDDSVRQMQICGQNGKPDRSAEFRLFGQNWLNPGRPVSPICANSSPGCRRYHLERRSGALDRVAKELRSPGERGLDCINVHYTGETIQGGVKAGHSEGGIEDLPGSCSSITCQCRKSARLAQQRTRSSPPRQGSLHIADVIARIQGTPALSSTSKRACRA